MRVENPKATCWPWELLGSVHLEHETWTVVGEKPDCSGATINGSVIFPGTVIEEILTLETVLLVDLDVLFDGSFGFSRHVVPEKKRGNDKVMCFTLTSWTACSLSREESLSTVINHMQRKHVQH